MTKTLTYPAFIIASLLIVLSFVTAQTYSQMAVGIVLYPALIVSAFGIFPPITWKLPRIKKLLPVKLDKSKEETPRPPREIAYISDIDKRAFIKLIGATGISFFLFSLLGRRVEHLIFGRTGESGITPLQSTDNQLGLAGPSLTDGYKIAEIAEGAITYYGFINKEGAWLIMRHDTSDNSFRYAKEGSNFPGNWQNRENLKYDYSNNVL